MTLLNYSALDNRRIDVIITLKYNAFLHKVSVIDNYFIGNVNASIYIYAQEAFKRMFYYLLFLIYLLVTHGELALFKYIYEYYIYCICILYINILYTYIHNKHKELRNFA